MRVLGAILAGGQSRRFGSDKADAMLGAQSLFEHVVEILGAQTDGLVTCGREWPGLTGLADHPAPGLGPLAGLNAALHYAHAAGFDAVLCAPVDVHPLPRDLRRLAGDGAKVLATQHAVGFWPVRLRRTLDTHLGQGNRSLRSWIERSGAALVSDVALALVNVNRPSDLHLLQSQQHVSQHRLGPARV